LRERAAKTLANGIEGHPGQLAVYKALLLGYRKAVPHEIHQRFKQTGTLHIFAISGLHVGIVGLLLTIVLKTVGIPRDQWGLWLLPLLFAYVAATGMKSSALRALSMAGVYFLAPLFRRKPDIPSSIAFAAMLLLLFQPLEILSAGFVFSFTVVGFIVMVFSVAPERILAQGRGWPGAVRVYATSLAITSGAAFIASAPLTALFFGSFAGVSLLANLLVVPLTFCIVLSGWLSILVPLASGIFNHAALVFIDALLGAVGFLSELPHAHVQVAPPPLTGLFFWYAGWIALLTHARTARQRIACLCLILFSILWMVV
jgi:ComEC/Rec2-related protein